MLKRSLSALLVSAVALGIALGSSAQAANALIKLDMLDARVETSLSEPAQPEKQAIPESPEIKEDDEDNKKIDKKEEKKEEFGQKRLERDRDLDEKNREKEEKRRTASEMTAAARPLETAPAPAATTSESETLGPNLIRNSSVESAHLINFRLPQYWKRAANGSNSRRFTYPAPGFDGSDSVKVEIRSYASGNATWMFNDVKVVPGRTYEYSDRSMSNVETEVRARFKMSDGSYHYVRLGMVPASSEFSKNTFRFTVPAGASSVTVQHLLSAIGSLTTDQFSLNEVKISDGDGGTEPATPLVPPSNPPANPPATSTPPVQNGGSSQSIFSTGAVSFRFDDAWDSQYRTAAPKLESYGFKGTFYIASKQTRDNGYTGFMSVAEIKELSAKGHEIGGHTRTHPHLRELSSSERQDEIAGGRQDILSWGIPKVESFSYPYGQYNDEIIAAVRNAGFTNAVSTIDGLVTPSSDELQLERMPGESNITLSRFKQEIDRAKAEKRWLIIEMHRIDNSGDQYSMTPSVFNAVVDYVKEKGLPVVTVSQGAAQID